MANPTNARVFQFKVVAVPDLHWHDREPPTNVLFTLEMLVEGDVPEGEYEGAALQALYDRGPCVVEKRQVWSWGLGADSVWQVLVAFIQSHGEAIAGVAVSNLAKEVIGQLWAVTWR